MTLITIYMIISQRGGTPSAPSPVRRRPPRPPTPHRRRSGHRKLVRSQGRRRWGRPPSPRSLPSSPLCPHLVQTLDPPTSTFSVAASTFSVGGLRRGSATSATTPVLASSHWFNLGHVDGEFPST
jgi:hypothetical protein